MVNAKDLSLAHQILIENNQGKKSYLSLGGHIGLGFPSLNAQYSVGLL